MPEIYCVKNDSPPYLEKNIMEFCSRKTSQALSALGTDLHWHQWGRNKTLFIFLWHSVCYQTQVHIESDHWVLMSVETLGKALLKTLLWRHRVNKFGSKESGPACWPNLTTLPPGSQVYMNDNTSRPNFLLIINILSTFSKHTDDPSRNRCMTRDCRGREDLIKWFRFGKNLSFKPNIKWPRITGICN